MKRKAPVVGLNSFSTIEQTTVTMIQENKEADKTYIKLRSLLNVQDFRAADQETACLILKMANRQQQGWLDEKDIKQFPGQSLHTIDQLWLACSEGRFGLSVQRQIYKEVGQNYFKLVDRIGWRRNGLWLKYEESQFDSEAPKGHLPKHLKCVLDGPRTRFWFPVVTALLSRQDF